MALTFDSYGNHVVIENLTADYVELANWLIRTGRPVAPRGQDTREVEDFSLTLTDPTASAPVGVGRKLSNKILAAEGLQWLGGFSDLAQLDGASNGRFSAFSDGGGVLYGAYGPRTFEGLKRAIRVLEEDKDSRQAVVPIWRPVESTRTKDLPCTLTWSFRIRNDELHMSTVMRSNDVFTGLAYDVPIMCRIGEAVAFALGLPFAQYHHTAQSFHVYSRDYEAIQRMEPSRLVIEQPPMFTEGLGDWIDENISHHLTPSDVWATITTLAAVASGHHHADAYMPYGYPELPFGFSWFRNKLRGTGVHPYFCRRCRYYTPESVHDCPWRDA